MKKALVLCLVFFLASCSSSKIGRVSHPQIKTVAIGKITNTSDEPRAAFYMIESLRKEIALDGSLKLVSVDKADIVITGKIPSYQLDVIGSIVNDNTGDNRRTYRASLYRATIPFTYSVKTRKEKWLIQERTANGYADFSRLLDLEVQKREGVRRAAAQSAKIAVRNITEAW